MKITVFKEATDLCQTMWWELLNVIVVSVLGIISTNCDYLIILLSLMVSTNVRKIVKDGFCFYDSYTKQYNTWSIMGMTPIALARRKQPGKIGSCKCFQKTTISSWYLQFDIKNLQVLKELHKFRTKTSQYTWDIEFGNYESKHFLKWHTCMITKTSSGSLSSQRVRGTKP